MSEMRIRRSSKVQAATVGTSTASASAIDCQGMSGGLLAFEQEIPTAATALSLYSSSAAAGPFYEMRDSSGVALSITLSTSTGVAYCLPFEVAGAEWLRIVSSATLGTANVARVSMKG